MTRHPKSNILILAGKYDEFKSYCKANNLSKNDVMFNVVLREIRLNQVIEIGTFSKLEGAMELRRAAREAADPKCKWEYKSPISYE